METELRDLLRDLVHGAGAESAAILITAPGEPHDEVTKIVPLGMGALLELRFLTESSAEGRDATIERAARALRACLRRWGVEEFPPLHYARAEAPTRNRIVDRIKVYLQAFANAQGVVNAAVTSHHELVTSAFELTPHQTERLPFLLKQIDAEARSHKGETSHVEVMRDDLCAFAFWVDACLVAFCEDRYSEDFLRHRARMVTREVGQLLPYLDDDPESPAQVAPLPE